MLDISSSLSLSHSRMCAVDVAHRCLEPSLKIKWRNFLKAAINELVAKAFCFEKWLQSVAQTSHSQCIFVKVFPGRGDASFGTSWSSQHSSNLTSAVVDDRRRTSPTMDVWRTTSKFEWELRWYLSWSMHHPFYISNAVLWRLRDENPDWDMVTYWEPLLDIPVYFLRRSQPLVSKNSRTFQWWAGIEHRFLKWTLLLDLRSYLTPGIPNPARAYIQGSFDQYMSITQYVTHPSVGMLHIRV